MQHRVNYVNAFLKKFALKCQERGTLEKWYWEFFLFLYSIVIALDETNMQELSVFGFFLCNVGFGSNLCVGNLHLWENEKKINFFLPLHLLLMEVFAFVNEIYRVLREFLREWERFWEKFSIENQLNRLKALYCRFLAFKSPFSMFWKHFSLFKSKIFSLNVLENY